MKTEFLFCVLAISVFFAGCDENPQRWPEKTFTSHEWQRTAAQERYVFANDILHRNVLSDLTKPEVIALLGSPDSDDKEGCSYRIKVGGKGFNQIYILDIRFDSSSGKVARYFVRGD